ncbi:MAG TPA: lysophospholipid acyltransferase family protein [Anaerolineales bacterium]|nr:lysophospholipid acyltransferase family protein [Anaerolineales bacterium]
MTLSEAVKFDPRDRKHFVFEETPLRKLVVWALRVLFRLVMKLEVRGLENVPLDGALIVACNHVTNWDVIPMQLTLPRVIFFMGKAELFHFPLIDTVFRNCGAFPVYRGEKDAWAMRHARKILDHEQTLGMFPEGTRSKGKGLSVAKTGTARLSIEANCPILPMTITGSDQFLKRFPHRVSVNVTFLPPLLARPGETPLALTDRLMFALASALPEDMRGVYAEMPKGFNTF